MQRYAGFDFSERGLGSFALVKSFGHIVLIFQTEIFLMLYSIN